VSCPISSAAENRTRIAVILRYECSPWCLPLSSTRALSDGDFAGFPSNWTRWTNRATRPCRRAKVIPRT